MKNWFADISMTRKLTIGFGAVLLLTIALAISGWLSLSGVIHRSELMERIAALNEALDELRVARLQYMLDNGDAKSAEAVTEAPTTLRRSTGTSRQPFVIRKTGCCYKSRANRYSAIASR